MIDDPGASHALLALAIEHLAAAQTQMVLLGRKTATERLASFILGLVERIGQTRTDIPVVEFTMTRADIADYLGLTIETVSRTLTQLQADGLVRLSGVRRVRLPRPAALAELCE